jgi:hypothetical protein
VENSLTASRSIASRSVSNSVASTDAANVMILDLINHLHPLVLLFLKLSSNYYTKIEDFCNAFPHHFCFDRELRIEHVGAYIRRLFPLIQRGETRVDDILEL